MKKILLTFLIPFSLLSQTPPAPPPPAADPPPTEDFGTTQNNIVGTQGRSFGGGSIIKPNPILTSADFAFIQNPTYESGWRYGTGIGYSRVNGGKGFGINAVLTFDLSQQTYSLYYRRNDWYFHLNTGRMGFTLNNGVSVTKTWEFLGQKEITISKKFEWRPETFITLCSPYYDIGEKFFSTSNTFNAVVGNNISYNLSKKFRLNVDWRMNMNTTPKWGLMNNVLIGTNLKF